MSGSVSGAGEQTQVVLLGVLPAGTLLRGYEIVSVLGQGGFGITYLGRDTKLGRQVAIKEYLPTSLALREGSITVRPRSTELVADFVWGRERFLDEARTLARLEQIPAVVRVLDFIEDNGTAYTVMALVRGQTLDKRITASPALPAHEIDQLLFPLLDGLEQVHAEGFLHRDIKPANIILDAANRPVLIDFGASRAAMAGRSTMLTAVFTPGYAAAEQMTSAKQGPPTDIYGLSATLYHAITGAPPPNAFERMLEDSYRSLASLMPSGFSPSILLGIDAGLAPRAKDRPQTIAEWRAMLRGMSRTDATVVLATPAFAAPAVVPIAAPVPAPDAASPVPSVDAPPRIQRRRSLMVWGAVAVLVLVLGIGAYLGRSTFIGSAAVQTMTADQLSKALEERRKAEALAAEKAKLEEEARLKAVADAEAKRKADDDLAAAQVQRQKAEDELSKLRADMEARAREEARQQEAAAAAAQRLLDEATQKKKAEAEIAALRKSQEEAKAKVEAAAAAKRAADEEAARQAEAETAAKRQIEEEARKKAAAESEAKRQADEALAKAQAETQKAEEEAARQKTETEAKAKAEREASDKKAAEAAEAGLKMATPDRQRVQVALSSLGFDTRGTDGVFGPRSREMIAAWQKARNQPSATGFLTASQQQALLKEAAGAITKFDQDQKKIEDDRKKAEEEAKKKAEEEAKAKAAAPAPAAQTQTPPAAAAAPSAAAPSASAAALRDGVYTASSNASFGASGGTGLVQFQVTVADGRGSGSVKITVSYQNPSEGTFSLEISPTGEIKGRGQAVSPWGEPITFTVSGREDSGRLSLVFQGLARIPLSVALAKR